MESSGHSLDGYLGTNCVPGDSQILQLQHVIRKREEDLQALASAMERLRLRQDALRKRKDSFQADIDAHRSLLSTFRYFSDDILQVIFIHCLPVEHNAIMSVDAVPLVLARVCKRWRHILYQTPQMWASLHIAIPDHPANPNADLPSGDFLAATFKFNNRILRHTRAIHQWLRRSGSCPLSISLRPAIMYPLQARPYQRPYLEILREFSNRWRRLEITVLPGDYSSVFASIPVQSLPLLEELCLDFLSIPSMGFPQRNEIHDPYWNDSGLLHAMNLRALYLRRYPFSLSDLPANWSQLTHLAFPDYREPWWDRGLTLVEAHRVLSHCRNLQFLSIDVSRFSPVAPDLPSDLIILPHLESLDILDGDMALGTLLKQVYTPRLRVVRFQTQFWPSNERSSPIIALLSQPGLRIEQLTINLHLLNHADLVALLSFTPFLTHLKSCKGRRGLAQDQSWRQNNLYGYPIDFLNSTLNLLTPTSGDGYCNWSRLVSFELQDASLISERSILEFIQKRVEAANVHSTRIATLKKVRVTFLSAHEGDDFGPILQRYNRNGLEVEFVYPIQNPTHKGTIPPKRGLLTRHQLFQP